jgi:hypothetical protein
VYVHYGQLLLGKQQQNEDAEMRNQDEWWIKIDLL